MTYSTISQILLDVVTTKNNNLEDVVFLWTTITSLCCSSFQSILLVHCYQAILFIHTLLRLLVV